MIFKTRNHRSSNNHSSQSLDIWLRFLRFICPDHLYEEIEGDLLQKFEKDTKSFGKKAARRRLAWNAIRFFRPGIVLRNKFLFPVIHFYMIVNYVKIAFRNFRKQKAFTALNVIGLSLGMAASLLLLQYVKYEKSFDSFHSRSRDIYRIQYNVWHDGLLNFESAVAVPAVGPALKNNFPEVEEFTRLYPVGGVMTYQRAGRGPITFHEEKMPYADPAIFKVFDFRLIKGDKQTSLKGPNKVLLSERAAKKYFNDEDPMGKTITRNGNESFEVTGIFEDVPENSHIKFDFLLSYETLKNTYESYETSWGWYDFYTYVLLKPNTNVQDLQAKWNKFLEREKANEWKNARQEFIFRPLVDIHLYSHLLYEALPDEQRDGDSVYALSVVAFFILIIALINYINLATARSFSRANEVGVRKVIGALRRQLIGQFLIESIMLYIIASAFALFIVRLMWTSFASLSGWNIPLNFIYQNDFWILYILLFIAGVLFSGLYPAIVLSSFKPVSVLKGKIIQSGHGQFLRKSLVIFQFVASIFLIIGSLVVYQQLDFMKSNDLGISIDKTIILRGPGSIDSLYEKILESFKNEVLQISGVKSITASTNIPGDEIYWTGGIRRFSGGRQDHIMVSHVAIDYDFISSFGLNLIAGRNFSKEYPNDDKKIIANNKLIEILEFKDAQSAIGERISQQGDTLEIVGVLEDYHQMSLKSEVVPMAFMLRQSAVYYALKVESDNYKNILRAIQTPWKTFFADAPIDYFFLDQFYNRQYEKEDRFGKVFFLFTGLAIFIASLGLLGLASFVTAQRTKEIGIRKVLGSTVSGIVFLLSGSFIQHVFIANLIAWPITWWIMEQWLQSFPYHISMSPAPFLLSGLAVVLIAFISVSSQTIKAALKQPVKALKYE
jgi:putative ABC transport system permease protein